MIRYISKILGFGENCQQPKNKYNWSKVPSSIQWIATNEDGYAWGYEGKPLRGWLHKGFWYLGGNKDLVYWPFENPYKGSWEDSLEERPTQN